MVKTDTVWHHDEIHPRKALLADAAKRKAEPAAAEMRQRTVHGDTMFEVRMDRVALLRAAIASGTYRVSAEALADKLCAGRTSGGSSGGLCETLLAGGRQDLTPTS